MLTDIQKLTTLINNNHLEEFINTQLEENKEKTKLFKSIEKAANKNKNELVDLNREIMLVKACLDEKREELAKLKENMSKEQLMEAIAQLRSNSSQYQDVSIDSMKKYYYDIDKFDEIWFEKYQQLTTFMRCVNDKIKTFR